MKILILANNDVGLFRFRKELISELCTNNSVYLSLPYGDLIPNLEALGCTYIKTEIERHGKNPFKDFKLFSTYKKIIREIKPDIILTYTIKPNIYGGLAARRTKTPYVSNITGLGNSIENKGLTRTIALTLYKIGIKKANVVFFQNKANLKSLVNHKIVSNEQARLLPGSGVNLAENKYEDYPKSDNKITFVTIGRVLRDKGIYELIEAAKIIKQDHLNVEFRLIGPLDGDCKGILDEAVNNRIIEYLGQRNDIHDLIKVSHATIHPSYHEGTSNVLLETAAAGRPILASDVPGCNNTFDKDVSGIAFLPRDVASLVEAIKRFLSLSNSEKKTMGIRGREKMEKEFDRRIIVEEYKNVIYGITSRKGE